MNTTEFQNACAMVMAGDREKSGIGTLSEKTLHAVLKHYFEPDYEKQEVKVGRYVADISGDNGIIEVQTQGYNKLRNKLSAFLEHTPVTVVYPIAETKWLSWIDQETGEHSKRRKSPKTGTVHDAFYELYKIKSHLLHPNLRLCLVLLELEEFRYLNGWSKDRKRGSSRCERLPIALRAEVHIHSPADYAKLVPPTLPQSFTTKDFAKAARLRLPSAQLALNVLYYVNTVTRTGKQGNLIVYERAF